MDIKESILEKIGQNIRGTEEIDGHEIEVHDQLYQDIYEESKGLVINGEKLELKDIPRELLQGLWEKVKPEPQEEDNDYIEEIREAEEKINVSLKTLNIETDQYLTSMEYMGPYGDGPVIEYIPKHEYLKKGFTDPFEGFIEKILYDFGITHIKNSFNVVDMPEIELNRVIMDLASKLLAKSLVKVKVRIEKGLVDDYSYPRTVYIPKNVIERNKKEGEI